MIEIGKQKEIVVRHKLKGKLVPLQDEHGKRVVKTVSSEVWRETRSIIGSGYGPDSKRKLVVGLISGDVLVLKPKGTRQTVSVELKAVYGWLVRNKALRLSLEKARARKASKQAQRAARRIKYAEKKLREPIKP